MGIRVVLQKGETVQQALRRLNEQILECNRWPVYMPYNHKKSPAYYEKPSALKRRRRLVVRLNRRGASVKGLWYIGRTCNRGH